MVDVRNMEDFLEEKRMDETLEMIEKNQGPISFVSLTCVYSKGKMAFVEEKINSDWRREKPDLCQRVCEMTNFGWLFVDEFEAAEERREELNYVEKDYEGKRGGGSGRYAPGDGRDRLDVERRLRVGRVGGCHAFHYEEN